MSLGAETFRAVVRDNQDPDEQLRLKLSIDGLVGDHPDWIPPRLGGPVLVIPPAGAVVVAELDDGVLRWIGLEAAPEAVRRAVGADGSYGRRSAVWSPDGSKRLLLDNQGGALLELGAGNLEADAAQVDLRAPAVQLRSSSTATTDPPLKSSTSFKTALGLVLVELQAVGTAAGVATPNTAAFAAALAAGAYDATVVGVE